MACADEASQTPKRRRMDVHETADEPGELLPEEIITLNVGGFLYCASRATLCSYPESRLGTMFSGRPKVVSMRDADGNIFIDRNGEMFKYVLDYIRNRQLCLPEDFAELKLLKQEALYFEIEDMYKIIKSKITDGELQKIQHDMQPCHLLEIVDVEKVDYESYTKFIFSYRESGLLQEDELSDYPDANTAGRYKRGLMLKGETAVLLSLKLCDAIQKEIYNRVHVEEELDPPYVNVNLYRSAHIRNNIFKYLLKNKWQLVSSSITYQPEKLLSIGKYCWSISKGDCMLKCQHNKKMSAQVAQPIKEAEQPQQEM